MLRTTVFKNYSEKSMETLVKEEENLRLNLLENPTNEKSLKSLGENLYYRKDVKGAIKIYEKLVEKKLTATNLAFLGFLYYEAERLEEAVESFEKSLELEPREAFVHFLLGNVYSRMGKLKFALFNYEMAIFLDFDMYQAHIDFAKKYEEMGRFEKSLKEYKAAYGIDHRESLIKEKIELLSKKIKEEK